MLAPGFQESIAFAGRENPVAVRFAPNGQVFVAEKSGRLFVYASIADENPAQVVDLRASVYNYWDRGLLGLAIHPDYPNTPYLYVLYAHDTWPPGDPRFGDPAHPRFGTGEPSPSTGDPCADPTGDGCVVFGRLSRLLIDPQTITGTEQVMLEANWCQQYPSHSLGDLTFGGDDHLYVSAGEGASFLFADWGQDGTPVNPCGDPPDGIGGPNNQANAEGGALRSLDILTPGDATAFGGSILRLDVSVQPPQPAPGNPLVGNGVPDDDLIVATGLRNPFRITRRPGTDEIWIGDVGWGKWEEINRLVTSTGDVENYGWPCYEGGSGESHKQPGYQGLDLCKRLYGDLGPPIPAGISLVPSYYAYRHLDEVVIGDDCSPGTSSIAGLAFKTGSHFPAAYDDALFFADAARRCVWTMFAAADGNPDPNNLAPLVSDAAGLVVDLQMGSDGRLYYVNFNNGNVYAVEYFPSNQPPTALIAATPTHGLAPLQVQLDASGSSDPEDGSNLLYAWDLDGDGEFDDSTLAQPDPDPIFTQSGAHVVGLRAEDPNGAQDVAKVIITAGNTPPVAQITAPSPDLQWAVGEEIDLTGEATDAQDGWLPAAQLTWTVLLHHCHEIDNCHVHEITSLDGVSQLQFPAVDHPYPSWLEFRLTAEDLPPTDWFDTAWKKRRKLTFDNSAQSQTLDDFPVLVRLDPSRIDYGVTQPQGTDLRFADAAGVPLPFEIESWNPGGVSTVWVKAPHIGAASDDDYICMYYDNPVAGPSPLPGSGVWTNGHAAVWHLDADLLDSTANGNDGTDHGTSDVAGQIGRARFFSAADWIDVGTSPSLEIAGQLTIEAWLRVADGDAAGLQALLSKKSAWTAAAGYSLASDAALDFVKSFGGGASYVLASNVDLDEASWRYVASSVNGTGGRVYVDGVDRTLDGSISPIVAGAHPLRIGGHSGGENYEGAIDELRISNEERSPGWIAAQNLGMRDEFIAYGAEETPATLSHTAALALHPRTVEVEISSDPPGLAVAFGEDTETTPFVKTVIVGSTTSISAITPQALGGVAYQFDAFSNGGAAAHNLVAGSVPVQLAATFHALSPCVDGLDNDADTLTDLLDPGCENAADESEQNLAVVCDDGADNDGDGLADAADPGCADPADASEQSASLACDDGTDNDGDALVDLLDPGCASPADASEHDLALACDDGLDNDGDGAADSLDPGCASPLDGSEQNASVACDDGTDDDGDLLVDALDPGCASPSDNSEQNAAVACDDGLDNDGDTVIDLLDRGCFDPLDDDEEDPPPRCSDTFDNDGDGLADAEDPGCESAIDDSEKSAALVCDDGVDNDADARADHPADPGCADLLDASEGDAALTCDDGADNDGDGLADAADPGCADPADASEQSASLACDDGADNDGDALPDLLDPGCASPVDASEQDAAVACDDGADNDGDALLDLLDPGCASPADVSEQNAAVACDDGVDNDADTLTDLLDPGCEGGVADATEKSAALVCDDGVDNDADAHVDHPGDPGCAGLFDASEHDPAVECDDGTDNDGDGHSDAADRGCADPADPSEDDPPPACDDGVDNDGDTRIDAIDPGCEDPADVSEHNGAIACDDGADNDGDALIDHPADPDCVDPADPSEIAPSGIPVLPLLGAD